MSTKIFRLAIITFFGCVFFSACKKGWLDVNYDATLLTDAAAEPFMVTPQILLNFNNGNMQGGFGKEIGQWMGYWCTPYETGTVAQTYRITPTSMPDPGLTIGPSLAEANAKRHNMSFYQGIMKVVQVVMWGRYVDEASDVPYFQSFKENISQPTYDSGKLVYEDLIKQLDSAQNLIKIADVAKNVKISEADIMFHGDKPSWARFINTMKLRLLVHQANVPGREAYIKAEVAKIITEGSGFLRSGEDAAVNPGFTTSQRNFYYNYFCLYGRKPVSYQDAAANVFMLDILKRNNDPRLGFFYTPALTPLPADAVEPFPQTGPDGFRGNKLGLPLDRDKYAYQDAVYVAIMGQITEDGPVTSHSTGILKGYDMPLWIMTSTESMFLQAEAVYRGWLPGSAEDAYKTAIRESFRWLNVGGDSDEPELSFSSFDNWYATQVSAANKEVSWQAAPDKYKLIAFQKYISFNGIDFFEAWVDYRRNDRYPEMPVSADPGRVSDKLPIRMLYPADEYIVNKANVTKMGTIDPFNSKIWWMP